MKNNTIGVIGLGYVGLTFSISLAKKGFKVYGYEINPKTFNSLSKGKAQFYEENIDKDLKETLKKKKLKLFKNISNIRNCNIVFITVGTPINQNKKINLKYLYNLATNLKKYLKSNTTVALRSTVKLGTTKKIEKILNKTNSINLAMCPERTTEGSALKEIHFLPQVIGAENKNTRNILKKLFLKITKKTILFNTFEEAEILKLIDNSYRDTIFGFANELSSISEHYNINILNVIHKIGIKYPRSKIAFPGTVGGPCLTKDSHLLIESVKKKVNLNIIKSARKINEQIPLDIISLINKKLKIPVKKILFCGLAFKGIPKTSDIRGSMAKSVILSCVKKFKNTEIFGLDNLVSKKDALNINNKIKFFKDFKKIKDNFEIIFFLNNNTYWKEIGLNKFKNNLKNDGLIYDFWSSFKKNNKDKKYFKLGEGKLFEKRKI